MLGDLKYALRQLRKSPGFAVTAVLTLAIGIGANVAVFSLMDALVLRPLAVPEMSRVVTVAEEQTRGDYKQVALANYTDWVRQSRSFEDLAVRTSGDMSLTGAGDATHVESAYLSPNFFSVLRAKPQLGRVFRNDEAQAGRDGEAVLSYSFWQRHFGADAEVVGRNVELNGRAYRVIGVMPRTLEYPSTADVFLPLAATPQQMEDRSGHGYLVIGRLRNGVTVAQAQAEMQGIAERLAKTYPATNLGWSVKVAPLLEDVNGTLTPLYMRLILGATGFVLLIVCANVANLQFARGLGRRNEIALRTALGASKTQLLRQLLAESLLLAVLGAAAGLLLAKLDLHLAIITMPERVARYVAGWGTISLSGRALVLSMVLAVGAGVVSGITPALEALRVNLVDQLKVGGRSTTGGGRLHRLRNIFAVAQVALSVALVIGAALMAKGMLAMLHRADVHEPKRVLTFKVNLPEEHYGTREERAAWFEKSLDSVRALPGVKAAEVSTALPEGNEGAWVDDFRIENRSLVPGQVESAHRLAVSAGYFRMMHMSVLDGRDFNGSDGRDTTPVALVSQKFVERYFPKENPLGHRVRMGDSRSDEPWVTIVGVVEDVNYSWTEESKEPAVYLNVAQLPPSGATYLITSHGDPLAMTPAVRQALKVLDATLPLDAVQTYEGYLHEAFTGLMQAATMLGVDAAIALLLAAIGIFGVMANLVAERRREIGVRLAVGARREDVLRMMLGRAGRLAAMGVGIGLVMAAGLAHAVASLLYGVRSYDFAVFATATAAIIAITLFSGYIPARRAAAVDPMDALREE
jgi:putative ABC transport system permease protein